MNVVLAVTGKFHTFDLARQMYRHGALQAIFTGYPHFKLRNARLPRKCIRSFPWLHTPYMMRLAPPYRPLKLFWEWQDRIWFDRYVTRNLPDCDIFCGLSGSASMAGKTAKKRGAKSVCDRGSSHITFQNEILREEHDLQKMPFLGTDPRVIAREEEEYAEADAITVPSTFALESFVKRGIDRCKLRLAPYGVDLSTFFPVVRPSQTAFQVLFVGRISIRKGISYLLDAFDLLQHSRKRLIFAGPIDPPCLPLLRRLGQRSDISVMGHLPQTQVRELMSSSQVMVLPSIEDGFGLVQAQAMACGCPVIASEHTGGADLFSDNVSGFITPVRDVDAIAHRLQLLADNPDLREKMSIAALERVKLIRGWDTYGDNMYRIFSSLIQSQ